MNDQTIHELDEAIQLNPENPKSYYKRGNARYAKGDYDRAIADYTKALQLDPAYPKLYIYGIEKAIDRLGIRGYQYAKKGEYELAIKDFNGIIKLDEEKVSDGTLIYISIGGSGYVEAYINRGYAYYKNSDYEKAIADFDKALQFFVIHVEPAYKAAAHRFRGTAYFHIGNYERAIADLDETIQFNKSIQLPVRSLVGVSLSPSTVRNAEADEPQVEREVRVRPRRSRVGRNNIDTAASASGDYEPVRPTRVHRRGRVPHRSKLRSAKADEPQVECEDERPLLSASLTEADEPQSEVAAAYNNRSAAYTRKGDYVQAFVDSDIAITLDPKNATNYLNKGYLHYLIGDYGAAIEEYDNAVRLCPNYETDFIDSNFAHGGEATVESAIKLLDSIVNDSPQSAADFYYIGIKALFTNDRLSAELAFQIASELDYGDLTKIDQHLANL